LKSTEPVHSARINATSVVNFKCSKTK